MPLRLHPRLPPHQRLSLLRLPGHDPRPQRRHRHSRILRRMDLLVVHVRKGIRLVSLGKGRRFVREEGRAADIAVSVGIGDGLVWHVAKFEVCSDRAVCAGSEQWHARRLQNPGVRAGARKCRTGGAGNGTDLQHVGRGIPTEPGGGWMAGRAVGAVSRCGVGSMGVVASRAGAISVPVAEFGRGDVLCGFLGGGDVSDRGDASAGDQEGLEPFVDQFGRGFEKDRWMQFPQVKAVNI
mmetsp:Transcript_33445/g.70309  ORF Transcript_33445/g.70309 Transcript_33445/m.70309 type:complete len:238 (+) Transcript_33445:443-1156(+)